MGRGCRSCRACDAAFATHRGVNTDVAVPLDDRRPLLGTAWLLGAALFWGIGFYAQRISIALLPPLMSMAVRFALTLPVVLAALWWCRRRGRPIPWASGDRKSVV